MTKRFSASSAAQLMQCPGSANLELAIPGYVEPKRDEMAGAKGVGTRMHDSFKPLAHWSMVAVTDLMILMERYAALHWTKRRKLLEDITEVETQDEWMDMFQLTSRDFTEIEQYVRWIVELDGEERLPPLMLNYVVQTLDQLGQLMAEPAVSSLHIYAEVSINCLWLTSKPATTPDIVFASNEQLDVVDYKTGRIPVSPVDNFQLMFYAYSALQEYYSLNAQADVKKVVMHIWQPRNHDKWECSVEHITEWAKLAFESDLKIIDKDLTLRPGSACTFCPANPHSRGDKAPPFCPAMMGKLYPDTTDEEGILDL